MFACETQPCVATLRAVKAVQTGRARAGSLLCVMVHTRSHAPPLELAQILWLAPMLDEQYSVLCCLRNQPLETQCWILAQFLS